MTQESEVFNNRMQRLEQRVEALVADVAAARQDRDRANDQYAELLGYFKYCMVQLRTLDAELQSAIEKEVDVLSAEGLERGRVLTELMAGHSNEILQSLAILGEGLSGIAARVDAAEVRLDVLDQGAASSADDGASGLVAEFDGDISLIRGKIKNRLEALERAALHRYRDTNNSGSSPERATAVSSDAQYAWLRDQLRLESE